jgi:HlyD family secretion protein
VEKIFVEEGDTVKKGDPILSIAGEAQKLNRENAELAARFSDLSANEGKLEDARLAADLARNKLKNDSTMFARQSALWKQQIGTKAELEQRELAYENSKTAYHSANVRFHDLQRQLDFTSAQSKKNLMIAGKYCLQPQPRERRAGRTAKSCSGDRRRQGFRA